MYRSPRLLFALFCLLFSSSAFSLIKPLPGYFINLKKDTVRCNVEFGDWSNNPKTVTVEVQGEKKILGVSDILGFGVAGYSDYIAVSVTYHTNPISGYAFPEEYSDNIKSTHCFLKLLVRGVYSLYELLLPERPYFFITEKDDVYSELIYRIKQKDMQREEDQQYKKMLLGIFLREGKSDQNFQAINNTLYTKSDMTALIEKLDGDYLVSGQLGKPAYRGFQAGFYVAGINNSFPSSFEGHYVKTNKLNSVFSPAAGINFIYVFPSRFKSFALGFSAGYTGYSTTLDKAGTEYDYSSVNFNDTTVYTEKFKTKNTFVATNLYLMYFINHFSKTRWYVKAGLYVNLSVTGNRNINDSYAGESRGLSNGLPTSSSGQASRDVAGLNDIIVGLNAAMGVTNGRHKIELVYYTPGEMASNGDPSFKVGMLGVAYYFTVFR